MVWETGELDVQVLRLADEVLILNDHRVITEAAELTRAVAAFVWALAYPDKAERTV